MCIYLASALSELRSLLGAVQRWLESQVLTPYLSQGLWPASLRHPTASQERRHVLGSFADGV